jgi:hypothetical protein
VPIQAYDCPEHGEFDKLFRGTTVFTNVFPCPRCGRGSPHVFKSPSTVTIKRSWNEQANLDRSDPYTQAKAQLRNFDREQQSQGKPPMKITEEAIQTGAKAIHEKQT